VKWPKFSKRAFSDFVSITIGVIIQAFTLYVFLIPAKLPMGGISGTAQIISFYNGWPIGLMTLIGNIPLFIMGWKYLGGRRFGLRTVFTVLMFSIVTDLIGKYMIINPITDDILLNTLYGGVLGGIGIAFVYRGQGTSGGTDILSRILVHHKGIPLSQTYLMTDIFIMGIIGITFGWENAMYTLLMLYISGIVAESIMEGARVARTATIITNRPIQIAEQIMKRLDRGITSIDGKGMYTGAEKTILYCVINRSEVERIKAIVAEADPDAFMVIGQAFEAMGEGFHEIKND
jgi:uncharacterized membrane-anchored protein YitT (DUF2179 family)